MEAGDPLLRSLREHLKEEATVCLLFIKNGNGYVTVSLGKVKIVIGR